MTNVPKSFRRGIELEGMYRPLKQLSWQANLTLSQNKIIDYVEYATHYNGWNDEIGWYEEEEIIAKNLGNTHIAYSPSVTGSSIVDYELIKNLNISLISKLVGKQYFDNTSSDDRKIDPYFINDLKVQYGLSYRFVKRFSIFLQINNLFNVKYINNAYGGNWYEDDREQSWAYYYPQAGIHFFSGIQIGF